MPDQRTIDVYNQKAAEYANLVQTNQPDQHLQTFIESVTNGGHVLDLGCGPGKASYFMRAAGLKPDPVDASIEMIKTANATFDLDARVATFDDIEGQEIYDGVWANFSLLHAPRPDLPRYLQALVLAMKPNAIFHIGMKTGEGEKRDGIDRLYTYVTAQELSDLLTDAGLTITAFADGSDKGLDGVMASWVIYRAIKNG